MTTIPLRRSISVTPAAAGDEFAVAVHGVSHDYGSRRALDNLTLDIMAGQMYAILGPNGGGKTTLFRLLSTLMPLEAGSASILGFDLSSQAAAIRQRIGVAFQAPSLDRRLTVAENIRLQGSLYGLPRGEINRRLSELLARFAIADRVTDLVERLSGGLRRRVELAKALIHEPPLLLLDEPTTGLDPGARSDVWRYLSQLREQSGTTIVFTTHYLDEADAADRLAILSEGRLVACGAPHELRGSLSGDSITIEADDAAALARAIGDRFTCEAKVAAGAVRLEAEDGHRLVPELMEAFPGRIRAVRIGKPTLEDVFIAKTGHRFWDEKVGPGGPTGPEPRVDRNSDEAQ
jgi:ABC-2 type transport system ATP-binding protein